MTGFGPIADLPVADDPQGVASGQLQLAEQAAAVAFIQPGLIVAEQSVAVVYHQPGLIVAEQSAAIVYLQRPPEPPSSGRRRQYYLM